MLSKKIKKEIEEFIDEWKDILRINQWIVNIYWVDEVDEKLEESRAVSWVNRQFEYGRVALSINEKNLEEGIKEFGIDIARKYILHELVHIFLSDYDRLIQAPYKTEEDFDRTRERTTELLAHILYDNIY